MSLLRFIEFLKSDKMADPAYRAYDLRYQISKTRLAKAMRRVGYSCPFDLRQALINHECEYQGTIEEMNTELCEWYVLERITMGEVGMWPYRAGQGPKAQRSESDGVKKAP
jgi:hypothetical protein